MTQVANSKPRSEMTADEKYVDNNRLAELAMGGDKGALSTLYDHANPFTTEYVRQEIKWLGARPSEGDGNQSVYVKTKKLRGRCDDYLARQFRNDTPALRVPILVFGGKLWMSLTPMEIQSMWVPLQYAGGQVGTAGLGLGYFPLKAAASKNVESVTVVEQSQEIIEWFNGWAPKKHPEAYAKLDIIHGDVREFLDDESIWFDTWFMDVYSTSLPDEVITDIQRFGEKAETYRFWGQELAQLQVLIDGHDYVPTMSYDFAGKHFLQTFLDSENAGMAKRLDPEFCAEALIALENVGMDDDDEEDEDDES